MSTQGHKRKRSLQDSPVALTLMRQARKCLVALQAELDGVVETTSEITAIMTRVDALQAILGTAKKPVRFCLVVRIVLYFDMLEMQSGISEKQIQQLCTRIARIYRHVSMRPGARMILDAVLLAVAEICADGDAKLPVAILPEMRIASGDGILLKNPTTSLEMWFTGSVDYGVCTYENKDQRKDRVLNADVEDLGRLAKSQIFLIEGKRLQDKPLYDFMPEAISQAAGLCEVTEYLPSLSTPPTLNNFFRTTAVRFCLTDDRKWIFSVFAKDEHGRRVCYEGWWYYDFGTQTRSGG
ncbi:hypothetical protein B0H14DRAFT_2480155 [Mycena olivaceomarginata]|nr:hypothetical protein B0H14DRAFT_2480155 [Mycena olivaceomarginata]